MCWSIVQLVSWDVNLSRRQYIVPDGISRRWSIEALIHCSSLYNECWTIKALICSSWYFERLIFWGVDILLQFVYRDIDLSRHWYILPVGILRCWSMEILIYQGIDILFHVVHKYLDFDVSMPWLINAVYILRCWYFMSNNMACRLWT